MITTVGKLMLDAALPEDVRPTGAVGKAGLQKLLVDIGHKHPEQYADLVGKIKDVGNHAAYFSGTSFELKDLAPHTAMRDEAFRRHAGDLRALSTLARQRPELRDHPDFLSKKIGVFSKIEEEVNTAMKGVIAKADNNLTKWVASGAKGDLAMARQMIGMSGLNVDVANRLVPEIAKNSFSEGLSPVDFMVHANGARKGVVLTYTAVQAPGAFAKELNALASDMLIIETDCGVHGGRLVPIHDAMDRFLTFDLKGVGHRNDAVTPAMAAKAGTMQIHEFNVRSPLTCQSHDGVCAHCYGLNEMGQLPSVGEHVGMKAAQAITEPLTQLALNNKHAGGVVSSGKSPLEQILQFMHAPKAFAGGATLAKLGGTISHVTKAPSGGQFVHIDGVKHYIGPSLHSLVQVGQAVKKGDTLSNGVPHPIEVVEHKGMAHGREYFADGLRGLYHDAGIKGRAPIFETIARAMLNHGQVVQPGKSDYVAGEPVKWQHVFKNTLDSRGEHVALGDSAGRVLFDNHAQFGTGHAITPKTIKALGDRGVKSVYVHTPDSFVAKPMLMGSERMALQRGDWMANLAFRFLGPTFRENAATGATSDIHGWNPYSAYAHGAEFGKGPGGRF